MSVRSPLVHTRFWQNRGSLIKRCSVSPVSKLKVLRCWGHSRLVKNPRCPSGLSFLPWIPRLLGTSLHTYHKTSREVSNRPLAKHSRRLLWQRVTTILWQWVSPAGNHHPSTKINPFTNIIQVVHGCQGYTVHSALNAGYWLGFSLRLFRSSFDLIKLLPRYCQQ